MIILHYTYTYQKKSHIIPNSCISEREENKEAQEEWDDIISSHKQDEDKLGGNDWSKLDLWEKP